MTALRFGWKLVKFCAAAALLIWAARLLMG